MDENKKNEIQQLIDAELFKSNNGQAVEMTTDAKGIVANLHDRAILETVKNNQEVQQKFVEQAQKTINTELNSIEQEIKTRQQVAVYNANEEACRNYGIDKHVPTWQIKLMRVGSGFWFVIYWIFASVTIVPLNVFFKGISAFIKNSYVVFVFALLCYLAIVVGIPLVIKYLS